MSQANKDVVAGFLAALGSNDQAGLQRTVHPEIQAIATGTSTLSGTRNYDEVLAGSAMLASVTRNGIAFEIISMTAEDDRVSVETQGRSTLANGTPYDNSYHFLATIRDGKIIVLKEYFCTKLTEDTVVAMLAEMATA